MFRIHTPLISGTLPALWRAAAPDSCGCCKRRGRGGRPARQHRHPSRISEAHPLFSRVSCTSFHSRGRACKYPAAAILRYRQIPCGSSRRRNGHFHLRPDRAHPPTDSPLRGRHRSGHGWRGRLPHCRRPCCFWPADGHAGRRRRRYGSCRPARRD